MTGILFRTSWVILKDGIIPNEYNNDGVPHAFRIVGVRKINGELYLVAPLTNGTLMGDKGVFYFPREVINKELNYGIYTFKDMDKQEAEYLLKHGYKAESLWWVRPLILVKKMLRLI